MTLINSIRSFANKHRHKFNTIRQIETLLVQSGIYSKNLGRVGIGITAIDILFQLIGTDDLSEITKDLDYLNHYIFDTELFLILKQHLSITFENGWQISTINNINYYWTGSKEDIITVYSENIKLLETLISEKLFGDKKGLHIIATHLDELKITEIKTNPKCFPENIKHIVTRLNKFDNKRSILLYGEPGTGKSTVARILASQNGNKYVSVSLFSLDLVSILELLDCLKPDAIILDEFDRIHNLEEYLSGLEEIRKRCPLIIATINRYKTIDRALIRPERFDDHFEIRHLDENFVKELIKKYILQIPKNIYNEIKTWPVVYITDLNERIDKLGIDSLQDEYLELKRRLELQRSEY